MIPETSGLELLAAVEQTLAREVGPALTGDARYKTLMAASAIRMVMREWVQGAERAATSARLGDIGALSATIRHGVRDDDTLLHQALLEDAQARASISNPGFPRVQKPLPK